MTQPRISLEQWAAFKAVVDEGSFAAAAEALNKSQSSVSYAVARLEELLPAPVFARSGRRAELTEAGKALYRQAGVLLKQAGDVERAARYLASGWEAEVSIAVDAIAPMRGVLCALQKFSLQSPQTRLRLLETTLSGTAEALLQRTADIALIGNPPPGFPVTPLRRFRMLAVAHPDHELFGLGHDISEEELRRSRQVVMRDTGTRRQVDAGWLGSEQRWTVTHPATSLAAVKAGLGFAFLPEDYLEEALQSGAVKVLPLAWGAERLGVLNMVVADGDKAGPAARAVAETLKRELGDG